jgi:hypothetical protein
MDKSIARLAENELIVDDGSFIYVFRPLSGIFERSNKRKLKIKFFIYNETAPLFEYTFHKSDGFIYQGRKVRVRKRDLVWLLKRAIIKEG